MPSHLKYANTVWMFFNSTVFRCIMMGCWSEYYADLVVEKNVLVELKAVKSLDEVHYAPCLNYLKATGLRACLLLNFGTPKVEIKRIIR
jgi:GxxExxY protein